MIDLAILDRIETLARVVGPVARKRWETYFVTLYKELEIEAQEDGRAVRGIFRHVDRESRPEIALVRDMAQHSANKA